jgi:hypothetical protein
MRIPHSLRVPAALFGLCLCLPLLVASRPQDAQDASVADAARRARDKKKNSSTKSAKVITDDDLDHRSFEPGQQGLTVDAPPKLETAPPSPQAVAAAEASDKAAEPASQKEAAEQDAEIAKLKLQVTQGEKDVDLLGRQLALDQDSYYTNPNYAGDAAGKAKLDSEKQQISDKQQEVDKLKARLAALEELKSHRKPAQAKPSAAQAQTETAPSAPPQP